MDPSEYVTRELNSRETLPLDRPDFSITKNCRLVIYPMKHFSTSFTIQPNISLDLLLPIMNCVECSCDMNFVINSSSKLKLIVISVNSKNTDIKIRTEISGENASSDIRNFFSGQNTDEEKLYVAQNHIIGNSSSFVSSKTLLDGYARASFVGDITIAEEANNTNAYQKNDNVLFSATAEATTQPILNISNNNVQCSHGATIGAIDEKTLFYMQNHGIALEVSKKLIADGIFNALIS